MQQRRQIFGDGSEVDVKIKAGAFGRDEERFLRITSGDLSALTVDEFKQRVMKEHDLRLERFTAVAVVGNDKKRHVLDKSRPVPVQSRLGLCGARS